MLTLNSSLRIPDYVSFSVVGEDAFLLNTRTNKYYGLEKVGVRLWELMVEGRQLKDALQLLLSEYEVGQVQLQQDILELVNDLAENGLIEIVQG
jgi:hypothetical protein